MIVRTSYDVSINVKCTKLISTYLFLAILYIKHILYFKHFIFLYYLRNYGLYTLLETEYFFVIVFNNDFQMLIFYWIFYVLIFITYLNIWIVLILQVPAKNAYMYYLLSFITAIKIVLDYSFGDIVWKFVMSIYFCKMKH